MYVPTARCFWLQLLEPFRSNKDTKADEEVSPVHLWPFEKKTTEKNLAQRVLPTRFKRWKKSALGGGFKDFLFSSLPGEMIQFD